MSDHKPKRISVTPLYMAVQSAVQVVGNRAFFMGRGWTEGLRVLNLPAHIEFTLLGVSSKGGVWRADAMDEKERCATHTTLMSLCIPQEQRRSLVNLSHYGSTLELVFSAVPVQSVFAVQQIMFVPLHSASLTPLFTHHCELTPERVIKLSEDDPHHLKAVKVKRRYVYPPQKE